MAYFEQLLEEHGVAVHDGHLDTRALEIPPLDIPPLDIPSLDRQSRPQD
jgi:hypothetical protein